jgi:hypothetical protein
MGCGLWFVDRSAAAAGAAACGCAACEAQPAAPPPDCRPAPTHLGCLRPSSAHCSTLFQHLDSKHPDLKPLLLLNIGRTRALQVQSARLWAASLAASLAAQARHRLLLPGCQACLPMPWLLPHFFAPSFFSLQARTPAAQALMKRLTDNHSFYVAPHGSNDDWWAAASRAGAVPCLPICGAAALLPHSIGPARQAAMDTCVSCRGCPSHVRLLSSLPAPHVPSSSPPPLCAGTGFTPL